MSNFIVNVYQMRDSSFNIGYKMGKYIKNKPILNTFRAITRPSIDFKNMEAIYSTFAPHLLEELEGLSQGLDISFSEAASLFSGYDVPKTEAMGCSAIMTKDYYVRNYDFSPDLYDGMFSLIQPHTSFATAGYNLQIIGRHDGVNEAGLVAGLHFVSNEGYTTGLSAWTAVRMVLDGCSTTEEAVHMLKEIPHTACYNFSLGDEQGNFAVVEASPENVVVRREPSLLTCVNHFQDQRLQDKNRSSIEHSIKRHNYLLQYKDRNYTLDEMFVNFKDIQSPIFFTDYDQLFGTLHTFSYAFQNSRILTAIARSEQVLDINFQEWVNGKSINEHILEGIIEE